MSYECCGAFPSPPYRSGEGNRKAMNPNGFIGLPERQTADITIQRIGMRHRSGGGALQKMRMHNVPRSGRPIDLAELGHFPTAVGKLLESAHFACGL